MSVRKRWLVLLCCLLLGGWQTGCGAGPADNSGLEESVDGSGSEQPADGSRLEQSTGKESENISGFDAAGLEQDTTDDTAGAGTDIGAVQQSKNDPDDPYGYTSTPELDLETESEPVPEITLIMVGDILLHTPVAKSAETEDGGYDFSAVFENVKEEISEADLALVNQEVIIGGAQLGVTGYPSFNAPYELGDALDEAGFDVILHATNHTLDKGKRGLLNCLDFWRENYPEKAVLGIHDSEEDQEEIYVYEQDGIKIAILNYTYGTNGIALPKDMPYGVDLLKRDRVVSDLQKAEELADFVIVCPHWGTEYTLQETPAQREWAQLFADNGADLVIGTHPHVIEPVKWIDNTLVYYSLGNFVNWTSGTREGVANRMVGGMASVSIGLDENGEAVITDYGIVPLVCHLEEGFGGVTVYLLEEYTEELAERNAIVKQDGNFSLEYCLKLCERVFEGL